MSLTNSPLCLSDQTAGSSPPCQSPHQYKLQGQLFTGRLLSSPFLASPLLSSLLLSSRTPFIANHWAIRKWSILDENRYLYHCVIDCNVLSPFRTYIDLLSEPLYLSPPFFLHFLKGAVPRHHFFLQQSFSSEQEVSCGFPAPFPGSFTSVLWTLWVAVDLRTCDKLKENPERVMSDSTALLYAVGGFCWLHLSLL